jgi:hypothetical protein
MLRHMNVMTVALIASMSFAPSALADPQAASTDRAILVSYLPPSNESLAFVSPTVAAQIAALTKEGLSDERATQEIATQNEVANTALVTKLEAALGGEYAGVWFEPAAAKLHIGVISKESVKFVDTTVAEAGISNDVTKTQVRSTWTELVQAQKRWNIRLADLLRRFEVATSISARHNAVEIELGSSVSSTRRALIEHEAAAESVDVQLKTAPGAQIRITPQAKCEKFEANKARCEKPITAGVTIISEAKGGVKEICTAGPLAIPQDLSKETLETYLLTAGHCIETIGEKWFALNLAGVEKEVGVASEALSEEKGSKADVGAIKIKNPGEWTEGGNTPVFAAYAPWSAAEPEPVAIPKQEKPVEMHTNCIEGQSSGEKCGTIEKIELTVGTIEKLVEDNEALATAEGDSGGPWISTVTASLNFAEGTHVGRTMLSKKPVYEPLEFSFKELALKLELLTSANQARAACPMMD